MKFKNAKWTADAFESIFKHFNEFPLHIITDRGRGLFNEYKIDKYSDTYDSKDIMIYQIYHDIQIYHNIQIYHDIKIYHDIQIYHDILIYHDI